MVKTLALVASITLSVAACNIGASTDDPMGGGADANPNADAATDDGGTPLASCEGPVQVPVSSSRPVEILPNTRLAEIAASMPCVLDPTLVGILTDPNTMWYDKTTIIPGYQDSWGDNIVGPIGMRPNTIDPQMINLAVPGGHAQIFEDIGTFHFPFGAPLGPVSEVVVVDFWLPPSDGGSLLPVVWWMRNPTELTHRIEWLFPRGTVLGEVLFMDVDGSLAPFELRARTRTTDDWDNEVYRPFPTAEDLAVALETRRSERPEWDDSQEISDLIAHLRSPDTLEPVTLGAPNFALAFDPVSGAYDRLPGLADPSILLSLLTDTAFQPSTDKVWKTDGALIAYAASTDAPFSIVPRNYNAGLVPVTNEGCKTCHQDAGRPFRDFYDNITAYGELWGEDEAFSWHPFEAFNFVGDNGQVKNFNYDNRVMRSDFVSAGLLEEYNAGAHGADRYTKIPGSWKDYNY